MAKVKKISLQQCHAADGQTKFPSFTVPMSACTKDILHRSLAIMAATNEAELARTLTLGRNNYIMWRTSQAYKFHGELIIRIAS
ncbi:hypothetical protein M514_04005 [Trichuris suis]|uniref:Uncharacterized protein n=1 Tax=Trichuris suis TaxID=68888 RepID=A0A085NSV9_9BILA|nr:hypothetical protein M513_04005 [Trichuris suis]KFD72555.1 hypothetical protein M514_04005 [Trichuris suis]